MVVVEWLALLPHNKKHLGPFNVQFACCPHTGLDTPSQSRYMHVRLISNSKPAVCVNAELLSVLSCSRQTDNLSRRYTASSLSCEWPHHLCDPKSDKQQKVNSWILNIKIYSFSSSCFYYG